MPAESTPRNLELFILKLFGNSAPTKATGTFNFGLTFFAPHTILRTGSAAPTFTWQTVSLSALGCGLTSKISPTTTP